jgi:hypothetical protein
VCLAACALLHDAAVLLQGSLRAALESRLHHDAVFACSYRAACSVLTLTPLLVFSLLPSGVLSCNPRSVLCSLPLSFCSALTPDLPCHLRCYLQGSLRAALESRLLHDAATGRPHYATVLSLALGVARAMHHLHSEGVLHGDLKVW